MKLIKIKEKGIDFSPQKILLYGAPKSGKTEAAGKLAANEKFKKVIWFDLENGYKTLLKLDNEILEKIELIRVHDTSEDPCAIRTVMAAFSKAVTVCDEHGKLKLHCSECKKNPEAEYIDLDLTKEGHETLVVVDSLTQLSASGIHHATNQSKVDLADLEVEGKATFNHWGAQGRYLDKILSDLQQLRCHVVMISHEQNVKMDDKSELLSAVGGTANYSRRLPKAFDHVIRLYVKNKKHVGISNTTENSVANAGSRLDAKVLTENGVDLYRCFQDPSEYADETSATTSSSTKKLSIGLKK